MKMADVRPETITTSQMHDLEGEGTARKRKREESGFEWVKPWEGYLSKLRMNSAIISH
jgi:hypothetical protein